ncbi:YT521-B-like domain-containing protein [Dichomitus squalens]|nr:YT521-B-like domain-containing protein [Dichomitus squalens]
MRATFPSATPARDLTPKPEAQLRHSPASAASSHPSPHSHSHSHSNSPRRAVRTVEPSPRPSSSNDLRSAHISGTSDESPPQLFRPSLSGSESEVLNVVYDASTTSFHPSKPAVTSFENSPERYIDLLHLHDDGNFYMSGDASSSSTLNMSDSRSAGSTSDQGRQPHRGRGMSQFGQSRRPPARPVFPSQTPSHPSPIPSSSRENRVGASVAAPSFQSPPPQYTFGQRGAYPGQYAMSQPHMGVVHPSQPQFAYPPPHPGLHAHDQSMLSPPQNQLMAYSPGAHPSMMQTHSQVYPYPPHSAESSSSSSRSHSFVSSPTAFPLSSRSQVHPAHPSPPPQSPLAPPTSGPPHSIPTSLPPHSASFVGQPPYSPMRYSTPPFAYPPHSFAHSPSLYAPSYPSPYPQPYPQPGPEQENQGTWWYLPPHPGSGQFESFQSPYAMSYSPTNTREVEHPQYRPHGSSPVASTLFPMAPPYPARPSPGHSSSSAAQSPYSPTAPSPQLSAYGPRASETPATVQQPGRPPDHTPVSSGMSSAASSQHSAERPPPVRRPYHPNPPAHRSEWVMWAGNVPSDATKEELWRFFNSPPSPGSQVSTGAQSAGAQSTQSAPAGPVASSAASTTDSSTASTESVFGGVSSIFLILRSNCAFVNFHSEAHLHAAIEHFNGVPLRSDDPRCPRLVCRVRGREDDLKSGVGGQRMAHVHISFAREQREREAARRRSASSSSDQITTPSPSSPTDPAGLLRGLSISSDEEAGTGRRARKPEPHSSSSGSYASTNSSILTAYFPKRYFILKSLTQFDLDLSVEKGLWATQRHNEGILDQAFRTSKEVYLIFSVNKSGEFYGYAKMAGPIMRGEARVSWASRTDSPQHRASQETPRDSPMATARTGETAYFSPSENRYGESPFPMSPETQKQAATSVPLSFSQQVDRNAASAPAVLHRPHRALSQATPEDTQTHSYDGFSIRPAIPAIAGHKQQSEPGGVELDRMAPIRAIRNPRERVAEAVRTLEESPLHTVAEEDERPHLEEDPGKGKAVDRTPSGAAPTASAREQEDGPAWGESFKVEWIRTERLPFTRTRHLRNPWNHDREVKVSRDGTELEPTVGQALLEEWDKLEQPQPPSAPSGHVEVGRHLQGKASISADVLSGPESTRKTGRE